MYKFHINVSFGPSKLDTHWNFHSMVTSLYTENFFNTSAPSISLCLQNVLLFTPLIFSSLEKFCECVYLCVDLSADGKEEKFSLQDFLCCAHMAQVI